MVLQIIDNLLEQIANGVHLEPEDLERVLLVLREHAEAQEEALLYLAVRPTTTVQFQAMTDAPPRPN